jgi:cytidylate kinase
VAIPGLPIINRNEDHALDHRAAACASSSTSVTFEERLAEIVVDAIKIAFAPLQARLTALEAKTAADVDAKLKAIEDRVKAGSAWRGHRRSPTSIALGQWRA